MYFVELDSHKFLEHSDDLEEQFQTIGKSTTQITAANYLYEWVTGPHWTMIFCEPVDIWAPISILFAFEDEQDALIFKLMYS